MNDATSFAFSYSTSPTQRIPDFLVESEIIDLGNKVFKSGIFFFLPSTALVPTSMMIAPGLIQSPLIRPALPAAAITISACLTYDSMLAKIYKHM